ncbi:MAG: hypothetical protein ACOC6F_03510 [bacterium]
MQNKHPLQEYAESCEDDLLRQIIEAYAQYKYESNDAIANRLKALFGRVLEERLDASTED